MTPLPGTPSRDPSKPLRMSTVPMVPPHPVQFTYCIPYSVIPCTRDSPRLRIPPRTKLNILCHRQGRTTASRATASPTPGCQQIPYAVAAFCLDQCSVAIASRTCSSGHSAPVLPQRQRCCLSAHHRPDSIPGHIGGMPGPGHPCAPEEWPTG